MANTYLAMSKIDDKIRKFILNNQELVDKYEALETSVPLEYCGGDIEDGFQTYLKINKKASFDQVLKRVLQETIKYNTSIIDGFDTIIKKPDVDILSDNTTQ